MSAKTIDGFAFSRSGSELHAEFGLKDFDRLADVLVQSEFSAYPSLSASLIGSRSVDGRSYVDVAVDASFPMVCQRCLGVVSVPLVFQRRLELVRSDASLPDEDIDDDRVHVIVSRREMSVKELVEDEVLLSLPMVAMHDDCVALDTSGE